VVRRLVLCLNPHYTFYYTVGFWLCNPLILLMKIGAIFFDIFNLCGLQRNCIIIDFIDENWSDFHHNPQVRGSNP